MQPPVAQDLATQFTEDAFAHEDRACQRSSCQAIIRNGQPCHYVASIDPARPGKFVCERCYTQYQAKPSTIATARRAQQTSNAVERYSASPDPQIIRQSIIAAQSRATVNPPPVVPIASVRLGLGGPNIHVPSSSAWNGVPPQAYSAHSVTAAPTPPEAFAPFARAQPIHAVPPPPPFHAAPPPPLAVGYGPQHLNYAAQRQRWAALARNHGPPPAQTITLEITAVFEGKKRNIRTNIIGNICEGDRDVDVHSSAQEVAAAALRKVVPKIRAYSPQFQWREEEFVVRDNQWVDLRKYSDSAPYFAKECFQPIVRKGQQVMVFKTKKFRVFVIVPESQWEEFEQFQLERRASAHDAQEPIEPPPPPPSLAPAHRRPGPVCQAPSTSKSLPLFLPDTQTPQNIPSTSTGSSIFNRPLSDDALISTTRTPHTPSSKRHRRQSSNLSNLSNGSNGPSMSKKSAPLAAAFASPNADELRNALRAGGATGLDVRAVFLQVVIPVDFHPIPTCKIDDLLVKNAAFDMHASDLFCGNVRLDLSASAIVGVGAFKTAQAAQLTLSPLRPFGIGSSPNHKVVLKRPHNSEPSGSSGRVIPSPPFPRYSLQDESDFLYREANVLYWAKALLKMTYDFIDDAINRSSASPPFEIPRLRFVDAGLILCYAEVPVGSIGHTTCPPSPRKGASGALKGNPAVKGMYLAEEVITESGDSDGDFVKYIHNGDAEPCAFVDPHTDNIAQFLSFTQHVQYSKTGGQVYISDYQGSGLLLTDPQILTHPEVSASGGLKLFCDGNVEHSAALFENEHICNRFCKWKGFRLASFRLTEASKRTARE